MQTADQFAETELQFFSQWLTNEVVRQETLTFAYTSHITVENEPDPTHDEQDEQLYGDTTEEESHPEAYGDANEPYPNAQEDYGDANEPYPNDYEDYGDANEDYLNAHDTYHHTDQEPYNDDVYDD